MAKKYERRRRERKESLARGEEPRGRQWVARTDSEVEMPVARTGHRAGPGTVIIICGLLVLSAVLVFVQTAGHQFVNCDDNEYVYENVFIHRGLTSDCIKWAITQPHSANWHPLTWMSHALDWQLFGKWNADLNRYVDSWPGGHHLVNLALHAICTVLLFLILQSMTGATWPSAAVAALFAVHPLHVESVAWATGRKDTLSALFFLLTLAAYHRYALRAFSWTRYGTLRGFPWGNYALVVVAFALGLASKPMLVTVPFVLLLLDFWPLRRIPALPPLLFSAADVRVLLEKVPLFVLSVISCRLTTWAQASVGAFKPLDFPYRLANAVISYAAFLGQMFWPAGMVVQYVHKGSSLRFEDTLLPLAFLVPITLAALWFGWRRRYLLVGWLWYVGMLVPVIGLVQVGAQARADRYTYLTQIGLYIMLAWGLSELVGAWRGAIKARSASEAGGSTPRSLTRGYAVGLHSLLSVNGICAAATAAALAALAAVAWLQTSHWRDGATRWAHSLACQPNNDFVLNLYADALNAQNRTEEANRYYRLSFKTNPKYLTPLCNLAGNLYKQGKAAEALQVCDEALQVDPDDAKVHLLRAVSLYGTGQVDASIDEFRTAITKNPGTENTRGDLADIHADLAEVLRANKHDFDGARKECFAALEIKPESIEAHRTLGRIFLDKGDPARAEEQYRTALKFRPSDPLSQEGLTDALWQQGKFREAVERYKQQAAANPQNILATVNVVRRLINDPRPEARFGAEALEIARHLCETTGYKNIFALEVLAGAYAETGDFAQAEAAIRKALETPEGRTPKNAAVLQQRILIYQAQKKAPIPSAMP